MENNLVDKCIDVICFKGRDDYKFQAYESIFDDINKNSSSNLSEEQK